MWNTLPNLLTLARIAIIPVIVTLIWPGIESRHTPARVGEGPDPPVPPEFWADDGSDTPPASRRVPVLVPCRQY